MSVALASSSRQSGQFSICRQSPPSIARKHSRSWGVRSSGGALGSTFNHSVEGDVLSACLSTFQNDHHLAHSQRPRRLIRLRLPPGLFGLGGLRRRATGQEQRRQSEPKQKPHPPRRGLRSPDDSPEFVGGRFNNSATDTPIVRHTHRISPGNHSRGNQPLAPRTKFPQRPSPYHVYCPPGRRAAGQ